MPVHAKYEYMSMRDFSDREVSEMCTQYFDQEAASYDEFDESVERRTKYLHAIDDYVAAKLSALTECSQVLSFGCGTGRRERQICESSGQSPRIVGVERSPKMAEIARSRGIRVVPNVGSSELPPLGSVDAVLCLYSFIHLPSISSRLETLRRLVTFLRPGGIFIVDVFNINDKYEWPSKLADGGYGVKPKEDGQYGGDVLYKRIGGSNISYMHYFSVGEIATLIEECGLVVSELLGVGHGHEAGRIGVPLDEGCILILGSKPVK